MSNNSSNSRSLNKKSSMENVSYESFAPRSLSQRNRLERLEILLAGVSGGVGDSRSLEKEAEESKKGNGNNNTSSIMSCWLPSSSSSSLSYYGVESSVVSGNGSADDKRIVCEGVLRSAYEESERLVSLAKCEGKVLSLLDDIVGNIEGISKRHSELLQHSGELSAAAERLQAEEAVLTQHANEIGRPLLHYDAVDRISTQLLGIHFQPRPRHHHNNNDNSNKRRTRPFQVIHHGMSKLQVDQTEEVEATLQQLDASAAYFQQTYWTTGNYDHYDYKERAIVLRAATLDIIRAAVADRISQTTSDIQAALFPKKSKISNSSSLSADKLEASLIYTRFHGISSRSKSLLLILNQQMISQQQALAQQNPAYSSNSNNNEEHTNVYKELWEYCRNTYCTSRNALLQGTLQSHLDKLRQQHGLVGMTRLASVFLIRICTLETSLYLDFFGTATNTTNKKKNGNTTTTPKNMTPTNTTNGSKLMAAQLMTVDGKYVDMEFQSYLDGLCGNLYKTVRRGLVTLLDLDTLCQVVSVLREERTLANASPTTMAAARAISNCTLDAQERLIFCANSQLTKEVLKFKPTPADLNYPDKLRSTDDTNKDNDAGASTNNTTADSALDAMYASWFPPMRSVLKVLSKIFRVVEPRVFEDIALVSVQACTATLKDSALYIAHKSGTIHGDLFLVKHLLILREQLSPFDIQLTSVQRQLDFSDAGKAVGRFLANRNRRLFSMSNENALVTLLREGLSIQEASVDSKRDLEDALRSACNDFLEHSSTSLAGPIFALIDQLKKSKQKQPSVSKTDVDDDDSDKDNVDSTRREEMLKQVQTVVSKTLDRLEPEMGEITTQMTLYMDNSATTQILLRPIVRKVTRALTEVKRHIQSNEENDSNQQLVNQIFQLLEEMELKIKQSATATMINNNNKQPVTA